MKIAIISTMRGYSWAGTEEVWYQFAKLALSEGHEIILGADAQVVASDQVKELTGLGMKAVARHVFQPARLFNLKQKFLPDMGPLQKFSPDIVLLNAGSPMDHMYSPYIWEYCMKISAPKVFFCHFNSDRLKIPDRELLRDSFREVSGMVFVSEDNKRVLERQLSWRIPSSKVILNGSRLNLEKPLAWPEGPIRFAQVARLETEWKGHDILMETLAGEVWRDRDWTLSIFGNGPDEDYIRELVTMYDLKDKVRFEGYVRNVEDIYASHHVLLLPSRGEGTPLAALEAMMCGRIVIATDVGGNAEIIDEGISGYIAEAPTPNSFGKALDRAWEARHDWELLGGQAHARSAQLARSNPPRQLMDYLESLV